MKAVIASKSGPYYLSSLSPALPCQWCLLFQASRAYCSSPLLSFLLRSCLYLKSSLLFFQDISDPAFPLRPTLTTLAYQERSHVWRLVAALDGTTLMRCLRSGTISCSPCVQGKPCPPSSSPNFYTVGPSGEHRTKQYTCNLSVRCGLAWALASQVYMTSEVTLGLFAHFGFGSALCWAFLFGEKITLMRGLTVVPQVLCLACGVLGFYNMQWGNARKWLLVFHDN